MIKLFKNLTLRDYILIIISIILVAFQVWLDLKMPDYMAKITSLVQTEGSKMSEILLNGGYMLLCATGSLISMIIAGYLMANTAANFSKNVRSKLFNKVIDLDIHDIKTISTSSLITRTTNDISQIQMLIAMGAQLVIKAPLTAIWAIRKILNKSWQWSALTGIAIIILLTTIVILIILVLPRFKKIQKLTDKINSVTRENITGIRVIRAFNAEKYQENKFDNTNTDLTNMQLFNQRALAIMQPVMFLVMYVLTLSIYFVGAFLINEAQLTDKLNIFSNMIVFSSYAIQVIMSFLMLAFIFMMLPRAEVSANRINEVLNTKKSILNGKVNKEIEKGTVEFKNVSFKYPDAEEYLLKDISFKANSGETIAFIGSTGSGKSTIVNLIPRFYDATDGDILVGGINVKDYDENYLHEIISYIPQKAILFDGTIKSNIAYGTKKISNSDIMESLKISEADEFVQNMEDKENSHIASGGTNISGGQKQRLSIARAIARKPEIYIFDDSFSALDYKTDKKVRDNLKKYTKDATLLIVAQRIGTIMHADKILVLDNGKLVGIGTHKELLKKCDVYKQIALSQLSKEEIENA